MNMHKFDILVTDSDQQMGFEIRPMLINLNHIVTIKPINIMTESNLIKGYWIRTSNGKKYRATKVPDNLKKMLDETDPIIAQDSEIQEHPSIQ